MASTPITLPISNCTIPGPSSEIYGRGILITIGDGSASQELCATASTVVNSTLLTTTDACDSSNIGNITLQQCATRRGGLLNYTNFPSAPLTAMTPDPGWVAINGSETADAIVKAIQEPLGLWGDVVVDMVEGLLTQGQDYAQSHFGLGNQSPLLEELVSTGTISQRLWSLNVGSQSVLFPRDGTLIFNGYDDNIIRGPWYEYPISSPGVNNRACPLQATISNWVVRVPGMNDMSLSDQTTPIRACIEPYDNLFRLGETTLAAFKSLFNQITNWDGEPLVSLTNSNLSVTEPGLWYNSNYTFGGSFIITLDNGLVVEIPNYELERPVRGIAPDGSIVLDPRYNEVQIFHDDAPADATVLPTAFLSQVYISVDYDSGVLKLAQANTDSTSPNSVVSPTPSSGSLNPLAVGLIIVGVALFLLILALVLWKAWGRRQWERWSAKSPSAKTVDFPLEDDRTRTPVEIGLSQTTNQDLDHQGPVVIDGDNQGDPAVNPHLAAVTRGDRPRAQRRSLPAPPIVMGYQGLGQEQRDHSRSLSYDANISPTNTHGHGSQSVELPQSYQTVATYPSGEENRNSESSLPELGDEAPNDRNKFPTSLKTISGGS